MVEIVQLVLIIVGLYLVIGVVASVALHMRGLSKIDHGVKGTSVWFRLIITPGLIVFWPLMLSKWSKAGELENFPEPEKSHSIRGLRSRHGLQVQLLAVLIPVLAGLSLMLRPAEPVNQSFPKELASLPVVTKQYPDLFKGFDVQTTLRSDRYRWNYQIELVVGESLPLEQPVLYWMPSRLHNERDTDPSVAVASQFIGFIQAPGTNRFPVSATLQAAEGNWVILSHQEFIALHAGLKEKSA